LRQKHGFERLGEFGIADAGADHPQDQGLGNRQGLIQHALAGVRGSR